MGALKIMGLFAIVPSIMLITISFFVMFILVKTEKKFLRLFGMVVVGLLWVTAFVVFFSGIYLVASMPDHLGGQGFSKPCLSQCPCSSMMGSGCGMMNKPYHKMNPHSGMMDPHAGLMMPPGEKPDK